MSAPPAQATVLPLSLVVPGRLTAPGGARGLGRVRDLVVHLGAERYPPVTGALVEVAHRLAYVPADQVAALRPGRVELRTPRLDLRPFARRPDEVLLREDVLDRQLVNLDGARLVRANDIGLARVQGWYRVAGVDTSLRGLVRRILPRWAARRLEPGAVLDWASVEPLVGHVPGLRLTAPHPRLARLHPAQIADLIEAASHAEGDEILAAAAGDRELEADVYEELDDHHRSEFMRARPDAEVAAVLARMESDDAADLAAALPDARREVVLAAMPAGPRRRVRALLGYDPATAGGLMSPDFVCLDQHATAAEALARVRSSRGPAEALTVAYATEGRGRLCAGIALVDLLRAPPEAPLVEIPSGPHVSVPPEAGLEEVARLMADFDLAALPVVDQGRRPLGVVTVDDVLELTLPRAWRRRFGLMGGE